jgi:glycogen debranching enzyme
MRHPYRQQAEQAVHSFRPLVEAHYNVYHDRATALSYLRPFEQHLHDLCVGSISEVFYGDAPHLPRGCAAQAWSVAEVLRMWVKLSRSM